MEANSCCCGNGSAAVLWVLQHSGPTTTAPFTDTPTQHSRILYRANDDLQLIIHNPMPHYDALVSFCVVLI